MKIRKLILMTTIMGGFAFGLSTNKTLNARAEEIAPTSEITANIENEKADKELPKWLADLITPQMITTYTQVIAIMTILIKLARDLKKSKSSEQKTMSAVIETIESNLSATLDRKMSESMENLIAPLLKTIEQSAKVSATMAKVFALGQENTPESKIAILELIATLGVDKKVIETAKNVIVEQEKAKEEKTENLKREIEKIESDIDIPTY